MKLSCRFCQHSFQSAFGPPNVRCPQCGNRDVVHADELGGVQSNAPATEQAWGFRSAPSSFEQPPNSVPSHVLNTLPWLVASVALAVFCQPIGLAGLYFSDQAKTLARWGRLDEAKTKLGYAQVCVLGGFALVAIAFLIGIAAVIVDEM